MICQIFRSPRASPNQTSTRIMLMSSYSVSHWNRERERNVLFNDTLNTFYLWLYGVRHMVKDHSDSEKGNPLPPHRLLLTARVLLYAHPTDWITHTTVFVTPVVEHWLEREIAQWVHPMKNRSDDPSHHERALYLWATSRSLNTHWNKTIDTYFVGFNNPEIKNGIHRQGNVIWNRHRALWTPYTCMFISIFLFLHPIKRRLISDIILSHINLLT